MGEPAPDAGPIPVVIIDDHQMFAESLGRLLSDQRDIEVLATVGDGAAGIEAVERHQPRVALLDNVLPDRPGVEVAGHLRRACPGTMVVMLTGAIDDRVLVGAVDAGCSGFLTKDHAAATVVDAVRSAAQGDVVIPPVLLARLLPQLNRAHRGLGADLSPRELEVLDLLATGASNRSIAATLSLSVNTVRNHVQQVLVKLGAHSKLEAVATAVREGITRYPAG